MKYRHEKHAGNHGDVLKHIIYTTALQNAVNRFPNGVVALDTHAGIGSYNKGEFHTGVAKISPHYTTSSIPEPVPSAVEEFVQLIQPFQQKSYPGSPALANLVLRPIDEHVLWEWNETEFLRLKSFHWKTKTAPEGPILTDVICADGFQQVPQYVTRNVAKGKHSVVLIDPPYENCQQESDGVEQTVHSILQMDLEATIMVWIPKLESYDMTSLTSSLQKIASDSQRDWICASMEVSNKGLLGSSVFIINPAGFESTQNILEKILPWLASALKGDCSKHSIIGSRGTSKE